jgi:hypothetical protein
VETEVLSGQASSHLGGRLSTRLARDRLLAAGAGEQGLRRTLGEMDQRLRIAGGECGEVPWMATRSARVTHSAKLV